MSERVKILTECLKRAAKRVKAETKNLPKTGWEKTSVGLTLMAPAYVVTEAARAAGYEYEPSDLRYEHVITLKTVKDGLRRKRAAEIISEELTNHGFFAIPVNEGTPF